MELFFHMPYQFNKKKKKMMTVGQTYCSNICDWPLTPWNKRFWDLIFPVQEDFLSVFSLWGEKKKEGNHGFKGAFCLTETVSQKLVFALNYMIVTCSLLLHICHVWHSVKAKISEKCYSFSIVFKYRAGGSVIPSYWWLYCTYKDRLHIVRASRRTNFSPSYK